jgi:phosphoglycolate phosphatase-like HAD superfamily hydrolase
MTPKLLLFDIDGTLLDTGGAGASALLGAAEEVLQVRREDLPPLDLAGATDGGVIRKLFADAGCFYSEDRADVFRKAYLRHLADGLRHPDFTGSLCGGVSSLLAALSGSEGFVIGLLTGNLRRGAMLKLERFSIEHHFADGGFGDDGEHRNELGPVAVRRMERVAERKFSPDQTIVIGDTPKDIACAHAMGARCVAVATGKFDVGVLSQFAAWQVLHDLADTGAVVELLGN